MVVEREEYIQKIVKERRITEARARAILEVCEKYDIEPIGNALIKSAEDLEAIAIMCKERYIDLSQNRGYLRRNAAETAAIFKLCDDYKIYPEQLLFYMSVEDLAETLKYIKTNFGVQYLKSNIIYKGVNSLRQSMPYLKKLGLLRCVENSVAVLDLTEEQIRERTALVDYYELPRHKVCRYSKSDKLNGLYLLTEAKFQKHLEDHSISQNLVKNLARQKLEKEQAYEQSLELGK